MKSAMRHRRSLFFLTASAVMVALSVILCRYLGFSPENTPFRFEIGFLPIAVVAYLFGPLYSGLSYLVADVIGSLLSGYAPNPWLTAAQALFGVILGLMLYRRKHSLVRVVICFSIIAVIVEIVAKSPVFVFLYGYTPSFALITRTLNALINLPIRIFSYYLFMRALDKPLMRILKKYEGESNEQEYVEK